MLVTSAQHISRRVQWYKGRAIKRGGGWSQTKHRNKNLPPRADNAFGINGFKYKPRSGVIIVCKDEENTDGGLNSCAEETTEFSDVSMKTRIHHESPDYQSYRAAYIVIRRENTRLRGNRYSEHES